MQKTSVSMKGRAKAVAQRFICFVRRRYKVILYYGAVILVLALVAGAAESYRTGKDGGQMLVLPENVIAETVSEKGSEIVYPENMSLLRGFSDQMEWNSALGQWEMHPANDYAFSDGQVACLSSGTVLDVGESGVKGGYIEIESGDMVYIYCSVIPGENILPGVQLAAGEIIGIADDSMPSELTLGKHVHLEVYESGKPVNFETQVDKTGKLWIDG